MIPPDVGHNLSHTPQNHYYDRNVTTTKVEKAAPEDSQIDLLELLHTAGLVMQCVVGDEICVGGFINVLQRKSKTTAYTVKRTTGIDSTRSIWLSPQFLPSFLWLDSLFACGMVVTLILGGILQIIASSGGYLA
jgi:hypothetical protein